MNDIVGQRESVARSDRFDFVGDILVPSRYRGVELRFLCRDIDDSQLSGVRDMDFATFKGRGQNKGESRKGSAFSAGPTNLRRVSRNFCTKYRIKAPYSWEGAELKPTAN
jgi:hypothetical protein